MKNNIPDGTPVNTTIPTSQQMYELRMIYGVEGARKILADYFGVAIERYKYGITPWEAEVIKKDNPNKNSRDAMICELVNRGVSPELVATMACMSKVNVYSIINYERKTRVIENKEEDTHG